MAFKNKAAVFSLQLKQRFYKTGYGPLYLFLIPGFLFTFMYFYIPMGGIIIAFKEYDIFAPGGPIAAMLSSEWVGLHQFSRLFGSEAFWEKLTNTLLISCYKIFWLFPLPVVLALLINEIRWRTFKRVSQTLLYLPHFLSWVVLSGLFFQLLNPYGALNAFLMRSGLLAEPIHFLREPKMFRSLMVITAGWKETGWNTIIYLAALTSIDEQLYEAARIDGANRMQQILRITLPSMIPILLLSFTIRLGHLMDAGFDQIFNMYNPMVYGTGDILQTYVYRVGIGELEYSFATAVGLFNSVVGLTLILAANWVTRKFFHRGIW